MGSGGVVHVGAAAAVFFSTSHNIWMHNLRITWLSGQSQQIGTRQSRNCTRYLSGANKRTGANHQNCHFIRMKSQHENMRGNFNWKFVCVCTFSAFAMVIDCVFGVHRARGARHPSRIHIRNLNDAFIVINCIRRRVYLPKHIFECVLCLHSQRHLHWMRIAHIRSVRYKVFKVIGARQALTLMEKYGKSNYCQRCSDHPVCPGILNSTPQHLEIVSFAISWNSSSTKRLVSHMHLRVATMLEMKTTSFVFLITKLSFLRRVSGLKNYVN